MANIEQTTMSHDAAQVRISGLPLQKSTSLHLAKIKLHTHRRRLFALKLAKNVGQLARRRGSCSQEPGTRSPSSSAKLRMYSTCA